LKLELAQAQKERDEFKRKGEELCQEFGHLLVTVPTLQRERDEAVAKLKAGIDDDLKMMWEDEIAISCAFGSPTALIKAFNEGLIAAEHAAIQNYLHAADRVAPAIRALHREPKPELPYSARSKCVGCGWKSGHDRRCPIAGDDRHDQPASPPPEAVKPAKSINQCDGCRAGKPVDANGNHRMGEPGKYSDLMSCTADRYR
jgi:hypothetical protein